MRASTWWVAMWVTGCAGTAAPAEVAPAPVVAPAPAPAAPWSLPGSPHDEEFHTFDLTWTGPSGEVDTFPEPGATTPSGKLAVREGAPIAWLDTRVLVTEPRRLTVKTDRTAEVAPYDAGGWTTRALKAGEVVGLVHYSGEGQCVYDLSGALFSMGCPLPGQFDPELDETALPTPVAEAWWVATEAGWIEVDPARIHAASRSLVPG